MAAIGKSPLIAYLLPKMSEPLWAPPVLLGYCRGIAGDKYLAYLARYEIGEGGGLNPAPEER
jgi:hypothetical protein